MGYDDLPLFQQKEVDLRERILLSVQRRRGGKRTDALRQLQVDGFCDKDIVDEWVSLYKEGRIPNAVTTFGFIDQIAKSYRRKTIEAIGKIVNEGL